MDVYKMANSPTRFSGPVVYSGKGINNGFFENLPIGLNPDYVVFMDDFITEAIDTDKWDTETLTGGTVGLLGGSVTGDDIPYGWAQAKGSGTTADSGAGLRLNESVQGGGKVTNWFEVRIGLRDADHSNLFVGFATNTAMSISHPFAAADRIGFNVDTGSAEIKCVTSNTVSETTNTGIDFEDYTMGSGFGVGGALQDTKKLGFRWTNPTEVGASFHSYRVDFFVDRVLVATHQNTADTQTISTFVASPWWAYTQGSGVDADADCALDYMLVASSRGGPANGKMVTFGSRA